MILKNLKFARFCLFLVCLAFVTAGCSFTPQKRIARLCADCDRRTLPVGAFDLSVLVRNGTRNSGDSPVHVYLEGDGKPWHRGRTFAVNPTSRSLTALRLMMRDPFPSIYLNRPCYGWDEMPANCRAEMWTSGRYSQEVVQTLSAALDQLKTTQNTRWLLIGHSGGGSLAMLVAQQRTDVAGVITLAANLDHQQWTEEFKYLPLTESMNPTLLPPLPIGVQRWHYATAHDQQVPAALTSAVAAQDPQARFTLLPAGDHYCCWHHYWPQIPEEMHAQLTGTK